MHRSSRTSHYSVSLFILITFLASLTIASCRNNPTPTLTVTPEKTAAVTLTPLPTSTATPQPLGTDPNPLIMGIVSGSSDPNALSAAEEVAASVQKVTGFVIKTQTFTSYNELIDEMSFKRVHLAFLPPLTYLYANQMGFAQVGMLANHFGVYEYASRIFANATGSFTTYYDPASDRSTANAAAALQQFDGKQPCWVDSQSPSGYIVPLGILKNNNINVTDGAFLVSPVGVIRALYITGICDFGATFATTGDPRTSPAVNQDLTDVLNRVLVIWQSDPVIPSTNLSFHPMVNSEMRQDLAYGFKDLVKDDQGRSVLSTAINYDISDLKQVDDSVYEPFRTIVSAAGVDLVNLIGR